MELDHLNLTVSDVPETRKFLIGSIQESEERVNDLYRRFKDDGLDVEPPRDSTPGRSMSAPRVGLTSRS